MMNLSKIFDKIVCVVGCYWDCLIWPAGIDVVSADIQAVAVVIILLEQGYGDGIARFVCDVVVLLVGHKKTLKRMLVRNSYKNSELFLILFLDAP